MDLAPVKSSNIEAIGYDSDLKLLVVKFKDGGRYIYPNVPADVHARFISAESAGKFFHSDIRTAFQATKIVEDASNTDSKG